MAERGPEQPGGWATPGRDPAEPAVDLGKAPGGGAPDPAAPGSPGTAPTGWGAPPQAQASRPADPPPYGYAPRQYGESPQHGAPAGWGGPPAYGAPAGWGGPPAYGAPAGWGGPVPGAPRPGVVPLRPLGLGELLDGSVGVVRRYPRPTLGLSFVVALVSTSLGLLLLLLLPDNLFSAAGTSQDVTDAQAGGAVVGGIGTLLVTGLAGIVLSGVVTVVVGRAVLDQPLSTGEAWRALRPRLGRLIGLALLTGLIAGGAAVTGVLLAVLSFAVGGGRGLLLGVPLALGGLVAAVYFYVRFALAAPALVLEKVGVVEALRRSGVLVRGSFWRIFGVLLLAAVIAGVIGQVLQLPFLAASGGVGLFSAQDTSLTALVLLQIGSGVAQTLTAPFTSGMRALLYVDRRMRAEGLDVALAAAAAAPRA